MKDIHTSSHHLHIKTSKTRNHKTWTIDNLDLVIPKYRLEVLGLKRSPTRCKSSVIVPQR